MARILTTEIRTEEIIGWKKIKAKKAYLDIGVLRKLESHSNFNLSKIEPGNLWKILPAKWLMLGHIAAVLAEFDMLESSRCSC